MKTKTSSDPPQHLKNQCRKILSSAFSHSQGHLRT